MKAWLDSITTRVLVHDIKPINYIGNKCIKNTLSFDPAASRISGGPSRSVWLAGKHLIQSLIVTWRNLQDRPEL